MSSNNNNQGPANLTLEIRHLDVVGGDSTLIFIRDNDSKKILYKLLIDSGAEGSGGSVLTTYLNGVAELREDVTVNNEPKRLAVLDCIIATHYHLDHIDGFTRFGTAGILFRRYMDNGGYTANNQLLKARHGEGKGVAGTTIFSQYASTVQANRVGAEAARLLAIPFIAADAVLPGAGAPFVVKLGETTGITLTCYCANGILASGKDVLGEQKRQKNRAPSPNDLSLAFVLEWDGFRYFTAGDLSGDLTKKSYYDIESALITYLTDTTNGPVKDKGVSVLRVSHHGSEHSNQPDLFTKLKPQVIIVSCNTKKKVPSPVFLGRLKDYFDDNGQARVLFVNDLLYLKSDDRYDQMDAIKDFVPAGNIEFKTVDNGDQVVTNAAVKSVHIRRHSGGALPPNTIDDPSFKTFNSGGFEIVLEKRSADDAAAFIRAQKPKVFKFNFSVNAGIVTMSTGENKIFMAFEQQAEEMVTWLEKDEAQKKSDGEDYIRLNYPGLVTLVEGSPVADDADKSKRTALKAALVNRMKELFNSSFQLTQTDIGPRYAPKDNSLSSDAKETIYYLLVKNRYQFFFNKAAGFIKTTDEIEALEAISWNGKGEFEEPYLPGGSKRKSEAQIVPLDLEQEPEQTEETNE